MKPKTARRLAIAADFAVAVFFLGMILAVFALGGCVVGRTDAGGYNYGPELGQPLAEAHQELIVQGAGEVGGWFGGPVGERMAEGIAFGALSLFGLARHRSANKAQAEAKQQTEQVKVVADRDFDEGLAIGKEVGRSEGLVMALGLKGGSANAPVG